MWRYAMKNYLGKKNTFFEQQIYRKHREALKCASGKKGHAMFNPSHRKDRTDWPGPNLHYSRVQKEHYCMLESVRNVAESFNGLICRLSTPFPLFFIWNKDGASPLGHTDV